MADIGLGRRLSSCAVMSGPAPVPARRCSRMPNRLSNVARLTVAAMSAGLLTAAITLPAVGGTGTLVVSATEQLNLKPVALVEPPLAQTSTVYDARGNVIARFYDQNREIVRLDQISEVMRT